MDFVQRIIGNWDATDTTGTNFDYGQVFSNQPKINSVAFKTGTNQPVNDIYGINSDFDISGIVNKHMGNTQNNNINDSYLDKLNKNLELQNTASTDYFSAKNLGSTLGNIGAIGGALANVYGMYEQKKFNKDMLDMEKQRVAKENQLVDKQQAEYDKVWKA